MPDFDEITICSLFNALFIRCFKLIYTAPVINLSDVTPIEKGLSIKIRQFKCSGSVVKSLTGDQEIAGFKTMGECSKFPKS